VSRLVAPFPYFGGKRRVAAEVWSRFGNVRSYVEPFFGSGAVLLARPTPFSGVETVNDKDGLLCNFWRAVQADPAAVARHADWPVSECDLHARHLWLVERREDITGRLMADPAWSDAQAAGWWVWASSAMAIERGRFTPEGSPGVAHVGPPRGVIALRRDGVALPLSALAERLRHVRIRCGGWERMVQSDSALHTHWGPAAVFLDPPYAASTGRDMQCYAIDSGSVAADVTAWALTAGSRADLRIAVCGYDEHDALASAGWTAHRWSTGDHAAKGGAYAGNGDREVVWFSPHCVGARQPSLL